MWTVVCRFASGTWKPHGANVTFTSNVCTGQVRLDPGAVSLWTMPGPSAEFIALQQALAGRYSLERAREVGKGVDAELAARREVADLLSPSTTP